MPPSSVEVPFLPQTPVLAVSRAQFGFPEDQATSQTRPVNSQGVPLGGVVPAACYSACVGCLRWIPTQKDAKTQFSLPPLSRFSPQAAAPAPLLCSGFQCSIWQTDSGFQGQYKKRIGGPGVLLDFLRLENQAGSTAQMTAADRPPYTALNYLPARVVRVVRK